MTAAATTKLGTNSVYNVTLCQPEFTLAASRILSQMYQIVRVGGQI